MLIPIEVAMAHLYADEADLAQVERKLASAIESAERYMGRRIYATLDELMSARASASDTMKDIDPTADAQDLLCYELTMQMNGVVMNSSIEIGILLILGDLYAYRESTSDKTANALPMGALYHLQPFRVMGV